LAGAIGVSAQSVTNWLKGEDFPRPDKLLRLATTLKLRLDELIQTDESADKPVVAFRRRAATKITTAHIEKAQAMGALLRLLVNYLPPLRALRSVLPNPSTAYADLQRAVAQTREKLGIVRRPRLRSSWWTRISAARQARPAAARRTLRPETIRSHGTGGRRERGASQSPAALSVPMVRRGHVVRLRTLGLAVKVIAEGRAELHAAARFLHAEKAGKCASRCKSATR
jgi:transcriptional regulator with XRE-family HTH domain